MFHVVFDSWRVTPTGSLSLVVDAAVPSLHLVVLPADRKFGIGEVVEPERIVGVFNLARSPDERAPEVAAKAGDVMADVWPAWLERRVLELLNGIGGLGTSRSPGRFRQAMRSFDPNAPMDMGHPLAPLGVWGPFVDKVTREIRKGRFKDWAEVEARMDASFVQSVEGAVPTVLRDDLAGRTPRMLLRERL